ncbi:NAD(P)/FAD-dependent oxidoreductase [Polyangium mundeleinium]|uniref:NAD(P)/FAD-dependent oxidoreductase n=1 Tax=Polyangium mundeleinium TaxID=2995306 RepID=A0ABT5EMX3_9BACT|nr:NAD(P)/FAD-dependent oxidoreductase [Polyangium mundeleinium]MDC0742090.1 NAD(P)/FAD-dependent oxidoreductase [Polyangium mundeleinium]
MERFDVLIVGGGPAGLGAALILGRCRREVLVCDAGTPRNAPARGIHGLLGHDGLPPAELLRRGREEARRYGVTIRDVEVCDVRRCEHGFEAELADGGRVEARKVVLATGMLDVIPAIEGILTYYGRGVYHCPICDGWECRDQPIGVLGPARRARRAALSLLRWSDDILVFTHGPAALTDDDRRLFEKHRIGLREAPIQRLEGDGEALARVVLSDGEVVPRRAIFLKTGEVPRSDLPTKLGCKINGDGTTEAEFHGSTESEGVFVVGDASPRVQLVSVAQAEGAAAAVRINAILQEEDLSLR